MASCDERLYTQILDEVDNGIVEVDLWNKALTLALGDKSKATYQYVQLKVDKVKREELPPAKPEPMINCRYCEGNGKHQSKICPACNGAKEVPLSVYNQQKLKPQKPPLFKPMKHVPCHEIEDYIYTRSAHHDLDEGSDGIDVEQDAGGIMDGSPDYDSYD